MKKKISFIVPLRGREDQIQGFEYNIAKTFESFSYEILYINQSDNLLFKRGQLCNIGFIESKNDIVVFQDIDIRYFKKNNFQQILDRLQKPFAAFDAITQIHEPQIGTYEKLTTRKRLGGWGACAVFYREQFIASGGFSNLIFGYGAEDNIISKRANLSRHNQELGHINHDHTKLNRDILRKQNWYQNNLMILVTDKDRNKYEDGYLQTKYDIKEKNIKNNKIQFLNITNITVPSEYKYMELYKNCLALEKSDYLS